MLQIYLCYFLSAGANFWVIFGLFWVIVGNFWAIFAFVLIFLWQDIPLCYLNHFLQLWSCGSAPWVPSTRHWHKTGFSLSSAHTLEKWGRPARYPISPSEIWLRCNSLNAITQLKALKQVRQCDYTHICREVQKSRTNTAFIWNILDNRYLFDRRAGK